jgi:pimeloyl-ACP methyl ester carboxylesterase
MGWTVTRFQGVHATRDIVLVDQRGTGGSNQLWLPTPTPPAGASPEALTTYLKTWAHDAFEALGADASTYTTAVAMDDLDAVRAALGYDRINLYGASYGATAAQYYVRQHPDHVRAVVLDGATLLDVPVMELIAKSSQRALDLLFERCAASRFCTNAYPKLRSEFEAVLAKLDRAPVDTGVPAAYGAGTIVVDRNGFAAAVHQGLIDATNAARLPWLIHTAAAGDWATVGQVLKSAAQPPEQGILVMSGMIRCSEAWGRFDPEETRTLSAGSYFLDAELGMARNQFMACPFAPKGIVPANDAAPATGSMPVLFVVGGSDPQDPPENIADARTDFPNSLTVVVPGFGHTIGHLGCMPSVIDAFVIAGSTAGLDTSCVATMSPPPFQLP